MKHNFHLHFLSHELENGESGYIFYVHNLVPTVMSYMSKVLFTAEFWFQAFEKRQLGLDRPRFRHRTPWPAGFPRHLLAFRDILGASRNSVGDRHGQLELFPELLGNAPGCETVHVLQFVAGLLFVVCAEDVLLAFVTL